MAEYVASNSYPHVAKISDPLLVRLDSLSLQVGDSVYHAKIKYGNSFKGYNIYVSGTNMPIVEVNIEESALNKKTAEEFHLSSTSIKTSEPQRKNVIKELYAKVWLDDLEEAIANAKGSSEIKQAIDRLNWQLHYDTTESNTVLPSVLDNFSDVDIDTSGGIHIPTMAEELNTKIQDVGDQITGSSSSSGGKSLSDLADCMSDINSSIVTMDSNMNNNTAGTLVKLRRSISDDSLNENSIYKALKGSSSGDGYSNFSVVTALRETGEDSVSGATDARTTMENNEFDDIEGRLGEPGTGNSIWGTVYNMNGNAATQSTTLWTHAQTVDSNVGTIPSGGKTVVQRLGEPTGSNSIWGTVNTVDSNIGTRSSNQKTVFDRLGEPNSSNTIWGTVSTINEHVGTPSEAGTLWFDVLNNAGGVGVISGIKSNVDTIKSSTDTIKSSTDNIWGTMKPVEYGGTGFVSIAPGSHFYVKTESW